MNNEAAPFAPMASPPPELAKALGWRVTNIEEEDAEERAALEFFQRTTNVSNPWLAKTGDGRLNFIDEDAEERLLHQPLEILDKLFTHAAPARITPRLSDLHVLPEVDDDEKEFFCPVKKLFFADLQSIASAPAAKLHKVDDWDTPIETTSRGLNYRKRVDSDGTVWNEGFDSAGVLKSAMVIISEDED